MISSFKKMEAPVYPADTATSRDGRPIVFTYFKHASLAVDFDGRRIYVDPVGEYADYAHLPKADAVLVTHSHYDHLARAAVEQLMPPATAAASMPRLDWNARSAFSVASPKSPSTLPV